MRPHISNHTCSSVISVAGIEYLHKKQLREKGVYLSLEFQAAVGQCGKVRVGTPNSRSQHIHRQGQRNEHTHACLLAHVQLDSVQDILM